MLPQNILPEYRLGADVAKATITFYSSSTGEICTLANNKKTLRSFLSKHKNHAVIVEATGGYEADLIALAAQKQMKVYRVNPSQARCFMRASGQNAKTDAIDAKALADYSTAYSQYLRPFTPLSPEQKQLRQLVRRRDELIAMRTQETNRLKAPDNAELQSSIKTVLKCLNTQIEKIESQVAALTEESEELSLKTKIMTEVKGVGDVTARNLLAALPELGTLDGKQIAALAGLAPFAKDSGAKSSYRRTGRGRQHAKRILFMSAMAAVRFNPKLKEFYERLLKNGKKPMVALIATARKLLVILNAKIRDANLELQQS